MASSKTTSSKGLAFLMILILCAVCMGGLFAMQFLFPSFAVDATATEASEVYTTRTIVELATPAIDDSSVITITLDELHEHDQETHRHDEQMNQAALNAVVEVAKSGDVAQGTIAATGDASVGCLGVAMLMIAVAMVVVVFLVMNKK